VTNPHEFDVDGLQLLGTSGQNVDDLAKYSRQTDR
jgi:DNA polymerase delta subunit 2